MTNKVLLTGATGFIGEHFLNYLIQDNIIIRALIRNVNHEKNLKKHIEIFCADLTRPEELLGACEGIDTVLHLGGYAHASGKNKEFSRRHHAINYLGTQNILNESIRAKVRNFIYFSSVKAVADANHSVDEQWQKFPDSPYGISKRKAESLVLTHGLLNNMHVAILRPALVYGAKWKGNLNSMLRAIDKGFFLPLPRTNNKRSMVSVFDLYQAAILAAENPIANGKIYFVTDGITYSTYDLYTLILKALGKSIPKWHVPMLCLKSLGYLGDIAGKVARQSLPFDSVAMDKLFGSAEFSSAQISKELNFKPLYDLQKMLPEIVAEYRGGLT